MSEPKVIYKVSGYAEWTRYNHYSADYQLEPYIVLEETDKMYRLKNVHSKNRNWYPKRESTNSQFIEDRSLAIRFLEEKIGQAIASVLSSGKAIFDYLGEDTKRWKEQLFQLSFSPEKFKLKVWEIAEAQKHSWKCFKHEDWAERDGKLEYKYVEKRWTKFTNSKPAGVWISPDKIEICNVMKMVIGERRTALEGYGKKLK